MTEKPPAARTDPASKAATLAAALPYMRRYAGKTVVVKYGGHAMGDDALGEFFAQDVVLLKQVGINPCMAAARRSARCSSASRSRAPSSTACA
jgi:hypothetical protein